jgi:hypothetical protein
LEVTRAKIARAIDECEAVFATCFDHLLDGFGKDVRCMLSFQPTLAGALRRLDRMHEAICKERRSVIVRKGSLNEFWFKNRLRTLASYEEVIDSAIDTGHSIGDAFAWLFYKDEHELLKRHFSHQRQRYRPSGIGGLGEFEFLKKCPIFEGRLILYHGITTFLRLGDFSLIQLRPFKVGSLVEIKTIEKRPGELQVSAIFIGTDQIWNSLEARPSTSDGEVALSQSVRSGLQRQMKSMAKAFEPRDVGNSVAMEREARNDPFGAVESALQALRDGRDFAAEGADEGLVVLATKSSRKYWRTRLLLQDRVPNFDESNMMDLIKATVDTGQVNSEEVENLNNLHMFRLGAMDIMPGATPFLHWPLSRTSLKEVLFDKVYLTSVYNPAHLATKLRGLGFEVSSAGRVLQPTLADRVRTTLGSRLWADESRASRPGFHRS